MRNKYKNYHKPALLAMLTPKRKLQADLFTLFALLISLKFSSELPDGTVVAKRDNPAVPCTVLQEIWDWMKNGATIDAVECQRPRTVPPGYVYNTWKQGIFSWYLGIYITKLTTKFCFMLQAKVKGWQTN